MLTSGQTCLNALYGWACERLYHELAGYYDSVSWVVSLGRWSSWRRTALVHLPVISQQSKANLRVLEIGFGTGSLLLQMKQPNILSFGLERSPAMQAVTQGKLQQHGISIPLIQGEAQQLPFANQSFDALIATFPAPYIVDRSTLREAARVLRPEGRLIVTGLWVAIHPAWLVRWLPFFYGSPPVERLAAYEAQIRASGFEVTWLTHRDGGFTVGGFLAQRRANATSSSL